LRRAANVSFVAGPQSAEKSLDRVIVRHGLCSRTQARHAIEAGRVAVDGSVVTEPDTWIDEANARVTVDGEPLSMRPRATWMLHKPTGYVTARVDHRDRPTVCDLLPQSIGWLAPVGRLDLDTSGLLLFTNDGELARSVLDPESCLQKTYVVRCSGSLDDDDLARLRTGIDIGDGGPITRKAHAERIDDTGRECTIELRIHEGRNRQVRRMIRALGHGVLALHRSHVGPLSLMGLEVGTSRALTDQEVASLRAAAVASARSTAP